MLKIIIIILVMGLVFNFTGAYLEITINYIGTFHLGVKK